MITPGYTADPDSPIPSEASHGSVVYYATSVYGGPIKIGTTIRLQQRLGRLARTAGHVPLVLLAWEVGDEALEQARLRTLGKPCFRRRGEWCWPTPELLSHIDLIAAAQR